MAAVKWRTSFAKIICVDLHFMRFVFFFMLIFSFFSSFFLFRLTRLVSSGFFPCINDFYGYHTKVQQNHRREDIWISNFGQCIVYGWHVFLHKASTWCGKIILAQKCFMTFYFLIFFIIFYFAFTSNALFAFCYFNVRQQWFLGDTTILSCKNLDEKLESGQFHKWSQTNHIVSLLSLYSLNASLFYGNYHQCSHSEVSSMCLISK